MPVADDVEFGINTKIFHSDLVNLYGCKIGDDTIIGPFVENQRGDTIGARCKISLCSFLCQGVTIEDEAQDKSGWCLSKSTI